MNTEFIIQMHGGDVAAALAHIEACLANLPRAGQTAEGEAEERALLEAKKLELEAL